MSGHADDQLADSVADLHIHDGDGDDYDDDDDEELAIDPHAPVLDVSVDDTTFKFNIDDFKLDDFLASPIVPPPPPAGPIFEVVHVDKPPRQVIRTAQDAPPTVIVNAFTAAAPDARRTGFRQAEMVKLRVLIGLQRLGVRFERVPPGARTSYPHAHKLESELVYCVQGNGVVWQNGYTYPFTQADVASWRAGTGVVHTIINDSNRDDPAAGSDLWLISVSEKKPGESWHYPLSPTRRAEITAAQTWDERDVPEQNELGDHPGFPCVPYGSEERGSASSDYPRPSNGPRPTNICNALERLDDAGKDDMFAHACSLTGETHLTGAEFGCNLEILPPGTRSSDAHAHSEEEEMVIVLDGTGSLWLDGNIVEVGAGDCVGFPSGTGIAHTFINDSNANGAAGQPLCLFILGENKRDVDKVVYPLKPQKETTFARWWKDHPKHTLGPHNGLPRVPRQD